MLRQLRLEAGLTQESLAQAAGLSPRAVSDLERGINRTARRHTARLLADALGLTGVARAGFEAAARGQARAYAAGRDEVAATRTLPHDAASFTGREDELQALVSAVTGMSTGTSPGTGMVVGIHAIDGMAGVGKTALAVHAAHRLTPQFPDGQIFVSLHGHTPGQRPADPADVLASLLLTVGVATGQIPPGLELRAALWRDRLAQRRLLLVLDDAASSEQIRPLLPGSTGSVVLVTSRRHLTALEDAHAISLDTLPLEAASVLLVRLAARPGLEPGDPAVARIVASCGYLPLAIAMLGRQLHHHPAWTSAGLAADLAAARDRLELMRAENLSVAAAFGLSYADLTHDQQRLFRRLGLHPGTTIDAYAAAALDGTGLDAARHSLEALYDQHLLTELARGRYRFHDLIREHAQTRAAADPAPDREQALERLLDYYTRTAAATDAILARQNRPGSAPPGPARTAAAPRLQDRAHALAWARAERSNLLACLDHATATGQDARIVSLTSALTALLRHDGPWTDAIARHATAAQAAHHLGDRLGQANALSNLGTIRRLTGDSPGATQATEEALGIYRDLGDQLGQANTVHELGIGRAQTGDFPGAAQAYEQALGIYHDLGDRLGQANTLLDLGTVLAQTGEYPNAAQAYEQALGIYHDLGDRLGQANTLNELGMLRQMTGDFPGAAQALEEALVGSGDAGHPLGQANTLLYLGIVRQLTGDYQRASEVLPEALDIYHDLGNRLGQANTLLELGIVQRLTGDYPGATQTLSDGLDMYRDLGQRLGQASALLYLGAVSRLTGDHDGAAVTLDDALGMFRDLRNLDGEATTLNEVGTLHRDRGDLGQAEACHRQSLDLANAIGSSWNEAHALAGLGRCALAAGRTADAETGLRQAQAIFQRIGAAEATDVAAELSALANSKPADPGPAGARQAGPDR